jgi:hypothetical protein
MFYCICTITTASDRAAKIVFALKSYARYDATDEKGDSRKNKIYCIFTN